MWLDLKVKIVIALNFRLVSDKNSVHVISSHQKWIEKKEEKIFESMNETTVEQYSLQLER